MSAERAIEVYKALHGDYSWEMHEILRDLEHAEPIETILELGCHRGDSIRIWHAAYPEALIVGVEPSNELVCADDIPFQWVQGESQTPEAYAAVLDHLQGRPVDFLYIDGDHMYDAVKADWEMYEPLVRPGGITVLHDNVITWNDSVEVFKFWPEVMKGRRTKTLYYGSDPADPYSANTGAGLVFKT